MKKHTNLIQTDWRNYTSDLKSQLLSKTEAKTTTLPDSTSSSTNSFSSTFSTNTDKSSVPHVKNNSGGNKLPGLGKLRNNPNNINRKFDNNAKNNNAFDPRSSKLLYDTPARDKLTEPQKNRLDNFESNYDK